MKITRAEISDIQEILDMQYSAFQEEARVINNYQIQPLVQKYEDVLLELQKGIILKAIDHSGKIVGSIRGFEETGVFFVAKLAVSPKMQKQGIGSALLREIEKVSGCEKFELYTRKECFSNVRLYEKHGYKTFKEEKVDDSLTFVYMKK